MMVSLATAIGAATASYYFVNRLNTMQEEVDALKRVLVDLSSKVDQVDRRSVSCTKSIKGLREDMQGVREDLSTIEAQGTPVKHAASSRQTATPRSTSALGKRSKQSRRDRDEEDAEDITRMFGGGSE